MPKYRVAVLGAGKIGGVHLRAAHNSQKVHPIAVADPLKEQAERMAASIGGKAYSDYKEMIDRERPDIAVIALPPFLHLEAVEYCAERGCHLLLEKPMARSVQECQAINQAVKKAEVRMLVGHTQHFIPENLEAKRLLASGAIGELVMMNHSWHAYYYNDRLDWFFNKNTSGGGILMNLGSHAVDLVQWFSSSPVSKVQARFHAGGKRGDIEAAGTVFLETESRMPAVLSLYGYSQVPKNEIELMGSDGVLRLVPRKGLWLVQGETSKLLYEPEDYDPYLAQLDQLADAIESGDELECGGAYGESIIAAIEAIYQSGELGEQMLVKGSGLPVRS